MGNIKNYDMKWRYWLMNKEKIQLIETILNDLDIDMINTLYEIVINNDYDYIENLFKNKKDFKDFIDKYKE